MTQMSVHFPRSQARRLSRAGLILSLMATVSGCATLPSSGPTASQIVRAERSGNAIGLKLVNIDGSVLADAQRDEKIENERAVTFARLAKDVRPDVIGAGDILAISIYEVGVSLFGAARVGGDGFDPSAHGENFPVVTVSREGTIKLPYVGEIAVAGFAPEDVERQIEQKLRGLSQNPQALVTIRENLSNTVFVAGDVRKPGRLELTLQRERLLDAIAAAGGAANSSEDTIVRFNRGSQTLEERLGKIRSGSPDDLVLVPGDRIELIKRPRSFIILGATNKVSQVPFETGDVSLAEAVARAGGPSDNTADPSAIFLFRYVPATEAGKPDQPVVYRLNLLQPSSYFLSQRFAVRDKDVIYIGNAPANQPAKLVAILNQLFSPFLTLRAITNNN
jgi:polysaccharide export outer membrane protein